MYSEGAKAVSDGVRLYDCRSVKRDEEMTEGRRGRSMRAKPTGRSE